MTGRRVKDHTMIGVYVRNDIVEALQLEADCEGRTLSNMAAHALGEWCLARGMIKRDKSRFPPFKIAGP